ncbi:MAG: phosphatidate cytidylyltransferase [Rickettsiales bacterium]
MEPLENDDIDVEIINEEVEPSRWSGLQTRIISAAIMAVVLLGVLWQGGWLFTMLILLACMIMVKEWNGLTKDDGPGWHLAGMFYAAVPCASLIWLRNLSLELSADAGLYVVLYLFLIIWATDIGAYFAGRQIGGPKLAPAISPGKTWAGLGGGVLAAAAVGGICSSFTPFPGSFLACLIMGAFLAVLAQCGDLFESWMKRRVGIKDSGTLIPGHGGLLDRVDGLTFTTPFFAFALALSGILYS